MIYTLTLNPAIDRTVICNEINLKDVTRVTKTTREAAGKGINVSKVIKNMGEQSICTGFLAGDNGRFIDDELSRLDIDTKFIHVSGNTRENIKVVSTFNNQTLELNEMGPSIEELSLSHMLEYYDKVLKKDDILVLAGSAPLNVPIDIYASIIERYKEKGVLVILDTSKELFERGIEAKPSVIKPNLYELESYFKKTISNYTEAIPYAKLLVDKGIDEVIVTLGKDGSLYVSKDQILKVEIPVVEVKGTVGAGDSFVAGYAIAMAKKLGIEESLKYASSVSIASCLQPGSTPGKKEDAEYIKKEVKINKI